MTRAPIIALALLFISGIPAWAAGEADKRADFAFINRGDIYTLDLNQMSYMQDFRLTYAIREGLYDLTPGVARVLPAGAVGHELSADKLTWTFHLRKECRWSNGDPVTARDYVFSWRRLLEEPGEYTYLFYYIRGAEAYSAAYDEGEPVGFKTVGIEAVDDLTLRVTLVHPVPYLRELLAFPTFYPRHERSMAKFAEPVPPGDRSKPTAVKGFVRVRYKPEYTRPPNVVTNGPFTLKQWDPKRRLLLEKAQTYWDRANVKSDTIEMVVVENPEAQLTAYESGAVDCIADVVGSDSVTLTPKWRKDPQAWRKDRHTAPAFGTGFLTFLCSPKLPEGMKGGPNPLADVRVRQALAMAIDKRAIVAEVTALGELPARTYLPPDGTLPDFQWLPGPYDKGRAAPYTLKEMKERLAAPDGLTGNGAGLPYDVAQARKLLAEAGYPDGKSFPILPLIYGSFNAQRGEICKRLKAQWKAALNIDVEVQAVEGRRFVQRVTEKDYAIATAAWYGDYPDASTFTDKYLSTSLQNDAGWSNKAYDDLVARAEREPDEARRLALLSQAEHLIDTEVPIVPLFQYVNASLYKPNVRGLTPGYWGVGVFKDVWVDRR